MCMCWMMRATALINTIAAEGYGSGGERRARTIWQSTARIITKQARLAEPALLCLHAFYAANHGVFRMDAYCEGDLAVGVGEQWFGSSLAVHIDVWAGADVGEGEGGVYGVSGAKGVEGSYLA